MTKDNIIEIVREEKSDKSDIIMKCPFRTLQVNYQLMQKDKPTEVHQRSEFMDCYKEGCFFYRNKRCDKVDSDLGRDVTIKK